MKFSYKEQHVLVSLYEGGDIAQCVCCDVRNPKTATIGPLVCLILSRMTSMHHDSTLNLLRRILKIEMSPSPPKKSSPHY